MSDYFRVNSATHTARGRFIVIRAARQPQAVASGAKRSVLLQYNVLLFGASSWQVVVKRDDCSQTSSNYKFMELTLAIDNSQPLRCRLR